MNDFLTCTVSLPKKKEARHKLEIFDELRLEVVHDDGSVTVTSEFGRLEVFGTELPSNVGFTLKNCSISIFSFSKSCVKVVGKCHSYVKSWGKDLTTIKACHTIKYLQIHDQLEKLRRNGRGLKILIASKTKDSGKSSFAKTLFSYGIRSGRKIGYVDLNVNLGMIGIATGTLSAVVGDPIVGPYSVTGKFGNYSPLSYFFGHPKVKKNEEYFARLVRKLGKGVLKKYSNSKEFQRGGFVVDTGSYGKNNTKLLKVVADSFQIDRVYVIGGGRLSYDLKEVLKGSKQKISVIDLEKSDGVVEKEDEFRKKEGTINFKRYFYGVDGLLSPHNRTMKLSDFQLLKIGGAIIAPDSTLPIGTKSIVDKCEVYVEKPTVSLTNSVLAISNAEKKEDVLEENIIGFVHVIKVDPLKGYIRILTPTPKKFTKKFFIKGSLKWIDT